MGIPNFDIILIIEVYKEFENATTQMMAHNVTNSSQNTILSLFQICALKLVYGSLPPLVFSSQRP